MQKSTLSQGMRHSTPITIWQNLNSLATAVPFRLYLRKQADRPQWRPRLPTPQHTANSLIARRVGTIGEAKRVVGVDGVDEVDEVDDVDVVVDGMDGMDGMDPGKMIDPFPSSSNRAERSIHNNTRLTD